MRSIAFAAIVALLLPAAVAADEPRRSMLVCYPGGPVKARQARPAMEKMLRALERVGGWPPGALTHTFEGDLGACRASLAEHRPPLVIGTVGLYLRHREAHHLVPVVRPKVRGRTEQVYAVVAKSGGPTGLAELMGRKIGGTPLAEVEFIRRVVFDGRLDPERDAAIVPGRRALRALRQLSAGGLDAVVLDGAQREAMGALPFAGELRTIFESDPIPLIGLAVDTKQIDDAERARISKAMTGLCDDPEGRALCDLFGVERFESVVADVYADVARRWLRP